MQKPLEFLRGREEAEKADSGEQENDLLVVPNWKRAVLTNEDWKNDIYIKGQLNNIQKGLLTKLATGKILVEGRTRYLCRDLLPLLACLLSYEKDIKNELNAHEYRIMCALNYDFMLYEIKDIIKKLHELDINIKTGNKDAGELLELFLLTL